MIQKTSQCVNFASHSNDVGGFRLFGKSCLSRQHPDFKSTRRIMADASNAATAQQPHIGHPLSGRLKHLPALLSPGETLSASREPNGPSNATRRRDALEEDAAITGQKRKRPRAARACELCRTKKYRCDERDPCSRCKKRNTPCIYNDAELARGRLASTLNVADLSGDQNHDDTTSTAACSTTRPSQPEQTEEVSDDDLHTSNNEYHGATSSLAFLATIQRCDHTTGRATDGSSGALASALHSQPFPPQSSAHTAQLEQSLASSRFNFRQSRLFLDGYFQNLHYIHPIIDKVYFLARCEDLWFGNSEKYAWGFVALYYAIMSLGALIQEWEDNHIDDLGRFEWSRKMFRNSADALTIVPGTNDLEIVQANMILAKVCQNELLPHRAYHYLGLSVRIAMSAGFNRKTRDTIVDSKALPDPQTAIAKTWWGLYSLEVEMSFSLGRPDSLGLDIYHNQTMLPVDETETAILTAMVDFARLTRRVSMSVYASSQPFAERLEHAMQIQHDIAMWADSLPVSLSPLRKAETRLSTTSAGPKYAAKQRHTLRFRYLNIQMVLFRPFLVHAAKSPHDLPPEARNVIARCVDCARDTIKLMHKMYCEATYFRTWFYNVTYTLYAASVILYYLARLLAEEEKAELQSLVDMSIEVVDAMSDHPVARKAAGLLRQALAEALRNSRPRTVNVPSPQEAASPLHHNELQVHPAQQSANDISFNSYGELDFGVIAHLFPLEDDLFPPWPS